MFAYEKLDAWKLAFELADNVYPLTLSFPREELYGLTQQVRRSAVSIAANIAERHGRHSPAEFRRFVNIANGSLTESVTHLWIAQRRGWIDAEQFRSIYDQAESARRVMAGLRRHLTSKIDEDTTHNPQPTFKPWQIH